MIHHLEYQTIDVFEAIERESSQNFRAFRVSAAQQGADVDALYQDMVITTDEYPSLLEQLEVVVSQIYQDIRGYSPEYFVWEENFGFAVEAQDCNAGERLAPLFEKVVQYMLLAWWYNIRMPQLAQQYSASASETMSAIRSIVIPTFGTRKLRMF